MDRRKFLATGAVASVAGLAGAKPVHGATDHDGSSARHDRIVASRLKLSVSRWPYGKFTLDQLCQMCKELGMQGVDLLEPEDWAVPPLYGLYHMQIMEGDVIRTVTDNIKYIGHFHTGGVPGRHEIDDTQELNYHRVMQAIADAGFPGFVAQEFVPTKDPRTALAEAVAICTV